MTAREDLYAAVMDGGYHSPARSERASALIDAFKAEVLAEAADSSDPTAAIHAAIVGFDFAGYGIEDYDPTGFDAEWVGDLASAIAGAIGMGSEGGAEADLLPKAEVVAWLDKKAREGTPVWALASKVERGAVRPNNLRKPPPNFFEPGHSYTSGTWRFRCDTITPSPGTGERRALGWKFGPAYSIHGWYPVALDPDDWTHGGWTETTDGGGV